MITSNADTVAIALCIIADAHHGTEGADYAIYPPYQKRYAWALDIVRQIARKPHHCLNEVLEDKR